MRPYIDFVDTVSLDDGDSFIDDKLKNYHNRVSRNVVKFVYFTKHEGLVHAIKLSARKVGKKVLGK